MIVCLSFHMDLVATRIQLVICIRMRVFLVTWPDPRETWETSPRLWNEFPLDACQGGLER